MNSKVLIFGGNGLVGSKFIQIHSRAFEIKAPLVSEIDILNKDQLLKFAQDFAPDTIINFAAYTQVESAEAQKGDKGGICYQINAVGAKNVADVCKEMGKKLIHISTEYVFDGTKAESPYTEEDKPNPINWYGQTKYAGEQFVFESGCAATIARICMPFSPFYELKTDVARFFLKELQNGRRVKAIENQRVTPTYVNYIVNALKVLVESQTEGLYHISSTDSVTPQEFAKTIAEIFQLNYFLISPISLDEYNKSKTVKLLQYSWLNPAKFEEQFGEGVLHTVEEGLTLFKKEIDEKGENRLY
ncbi:MAG: NAD(P)-dependent oxidoreductase [Candidatus Daviesbacteria bacterium]|nr:NAD(P)-dependent oxidoreductase [Candidatus Daviesbacteria bacterium]